MYASFLQDGIVMTSKYCKVLLGAQYNQQLNDYIIQIARLDSTTVTWVDWDAHEWTSMAYPDINS